MGSFCALGAYSFGECAEVHKTYEWELYAPEPNQIHLEIILEKYNTQAHVRITLPHSGFRITWGSVKRKENLFIIDPNIEMRSGPAMQVGYCEAKDI